MKKIFFKSTVAVAFLTFATSALAQKTTLNLEVGKKIKITSSNKSDLTMEAMGQTIPINSTSSKIQNIEIKSKNGDTTIISTIISKLTSNANAMGREESYDSDKKNNDGRMADQFDKIAKKLEEEKVLPNGEIVKIEVKKKKKNDDDDENPMGNISKTMNSNSISTIILTSAIGKELKANDNWADSTETKKNDFTNKNINSYTVTSIENGIATIEIVSKTNFNGTTSQMGQEATIAGNVLTLGKLTLNVKNAIITSKETTSKININIDANNMSMPMTGDTKESFTVTFE